MAPRGGRGARSRSAPTAGCAASAAAAQGRPKRAAAARTRRRDACNSHEHGVRALPTQYVLRKWRSPLGQRFAVARPDDGPFILPCCTRAPPPWRRQRYPTPSLHKGPPTSFPLHACRHQTSAPYSRSRHRRLRRRPPARLAATAAGNPVTLVAASKQHERLPTHGRAFCFALSALPQASRRPHATAGSHAHTYTNLAAFAPPGRLRA
ncbi:MAG: hypothetical protein J3K34DRAFT_409403 [Monoraphidium minutum]|nr:MAG: hypothetical protein J3K34DRAFT_409403 [Monoraphidium minutum]